MSRLSPQAKLQVKRHQLIQRTALALAVSEIEAQELLNLPRQQSVRLNPLVAEPEATLEIMKSCGWIGQQYSWAKEGYSVETNLAVLRDSQLIEQGAIYIQNAASWLPVLALDPRPGDSILDMCAAPGGKTTHLAARAQNQASITANDNSRTRLAKLRATCDRLQVNIAQFTPYDARFLAAKLNGQQFDKILLDAPCSGEGLMRYDRDKDFDYWSVAQIKRLQQLQKRLIIQAWQLLKPGGTLVYSTCTIAPEENEAVVDYLLKTFDNVNVLPLRYELPNRVACVQQWHNRTYNEASQRCLRLAPIVNIEAFFVACLQKPQA